MKRQLTGVFLFTAVLMATVSPTAAIELEQMQKLLAHDAAAHDHFGYSVSISGDTALVGAYGDDDNGKRSGSAYVFVRNGSTWSLQQKLTPTDAAAYDHFGWSVSISDDTALVGASGDNDNGKRSGSAYVFVRNGSTWSLQQKLTPTDAAAEDLFGRSVSISDDTALVGAWGDDDNGDMSGSAYVFVRSGSTWSPQQKLMPPDAAAKSLFGRSVSVSGDTALVGAPGDGWNSGSAYVFVRSGNTWSLQNKITPADAAEYDSFGDSVSVSGDTALVGAAGDDDNGGSSGSAYVFARSGSQWSQQDKMTAVDAAARDQFGISVSVSGDTALVGAYKDDDGSGPGSVYVFVRSGSTWSQQQKITPADGAAYDHFGWSVSVSGDTALVSARGDDDNGSDSGSTYVFSSSNQTPAADGAE